jgi:phosphatidylglycerophosphate synthase
VITQAESSGPRRVRAAYQQLAAHQKPAAGVPWFTRVVNRPLGRGAAAVAYRLGLTPDQVTVASALLWSGALAVLAATALPAGAATTMVVTGLLAVAFVLDSADGQLARLTDTGSRAGEWLDHVLDAARIVAFHLAVGVAILRSGDLPIEAAAVAGAFGLVASTRFFAQMLAEQLLATTRRDAPPTAHHPGRALVQLPADTVVLNACLLLLPWPSVFLGVYAGLAAANAVLLAATLGRRHAELRRAGREGA